MKICSHCAHENEETDNFCEKCGTKLDIKPLLPRKKGAKYYIKKFFTYLFWMAIIANFMRCLMGY